MSPGEVLAFWGSRFNKIPGEESLNPGRLGMKKETKTYNIEDSLVVTDPTTSSTLTRLSRGERTGSRVLERIWSYVLGTWENRVEEGSDQRNLACGYSRTSSQVGGGVVESSVSFLTSPSNARTRRERRDILDLSQVFLSNSSPLS